MKKHFKHLVKYFIAAGIASVLAATALLITLALSGSVSAQAATAAQPASVDLPHGKGYTGTKAISHTLVMSVAVGSPAAKAGLQAGDVIVAIDGKAVVMVNDLPSTIAAKKPGDTLALDVQSTNGTKRTVSVTLDENPNKSGAAYLGITYGFPHSNKQGHDTPEQHNGRGGHGVWDSVTIGSVQADSPAAKAGLQAGDVISEVNGVTLSDFSALKTTFASMKPGDKVTLKVVRGSEVKTIEVTLGEAPNQKGVPYLGITFGHGPKHAPKTKPASTSSVG